jgi:hypothetical protein
MHCTKPATLLRLVLVPSVARASHLVSVLFGSTK